MSITTRVQIFLLVLLFGFLAGPHVMEALQKRDAIASSPLSTAPMPLTEVASSETSTPRIVPLQTKTKLAPLDPFLSFTPEAKGIYVWDIATHRKLYGINEYRPLPLASVTKIMTALVATEILPPNTPITITSADLDEEGDNGLFAGEEWTFKDLLQFTLVASSNDGASAIARTAGEKLFGDATSSDPNVAKALFIKKMNERANDIGLLNTTFANETGLDISATTSGEYGSPRDMAMLFEYTYKKYPELFPPTTHTTIDVTSLTGLPHHVQNTNDDVGHIAGILASKTGFTDLAGGNLVILFDMGNNHPIAIAVLGSTREGRFTDVEALHRATITTLTGEGKGAGVTR